MNSKTVSKPRLVRFMAGAWLLLALKCALVVWAVERWDVPLHAGWVVWPTLAFGLLATALWRAGERELSRE